MRISAHQGRAEEVHEDGVEIHAREAENKAHKGAGRQKTPPPRAHVRRPHGADRYGLTEEERHRQHQAGEDVRLAAVQQRQRPAQKRGDRHAEEEDDVPQDSVVRLVGNVVLKGGDQSGIDADQHPDHGRADAGNGRNESLPLRRPVSSDALVTAGARDAKRIVPLETDVRLAVQTDAIPVS